MLPRRRRGSGQGGLGPELYTSENCLANADYNADSLSGLSSSAADTWSSQQAVVPTGFSNAMLVSANVTPTNLARVHDHLAGILTEGARYRVQFWIRHVGTGDDWDVSFGSTPIGSNDRAVNVGSSDTTFQLVTYTITHSSSTDYISISENSSANDGGVYMTGLSIKRVL